MIYFLFLAAPILNTTLKSLIFEKICRTFNLWFFNL